MKRRTRSRTPDYQREWRRKRPYEKARNYILRRRYGITLAQYKEILIAQGGVCAICGCPPGDEKTGKLALHVDHCHDTGIIRGLLCLNCNMGVGYFFDKVELLRAALVYLEAHDTEAKEVVKKVMRERDEAKVDVDKILEGF